MKKGIVTAAFLLLALTGCGGVAGALPTDDITYKFDATILVNPTVPQANQRVLLNLEVTSSSNRPVKTDIYLKVVSAEGETLYESVWNDVYFHEGEVWNLTQGFLPDSDAGKKAWKVNIRVLNQESKLAMYDQSIGTLEFGKQ